MTARWWTAAAVAAGIVMPSPPAPAQPARREGQKERSPDVDFNLEDADLPDLVKAIGKLTGKRFLFGGKLHTIKATVHCPEKITPDEAYSVFLSVLQQNQMTVVPHGRFLKIVDTQGVVSEATPVVGPESPVTAEERFVTRLQRLKHADVTEAAALLGKLKSKDGDISVFPSRGLLVITDTGAQIRRLLGILEEIDVEASAKKLWVEPIHHASAAEMAARLTEVFGERGASAGGSTSSKDGAKGGVDKAGVRVVADEKTNALVITAGEPDYLRMLELIKRLDVAPSNDTTMHVMALQHAGCKELSQTLSAILGRGGATGSAGVGSAGVGSAGVEAGAANRTGGAQTGTDGVFEGAIRVVCDEPSNKLVVTSSARDYGALRAVVDQLDLPRRQVFIEAVIMDVNVDRTLKIGVAWHFGRSTTALSANDTTVYGGNDLTTSVSGLPSTSDLEGLALGVRGPELSALNSLFPGLSVPSFGVVLHALGKDGETDILATPHILATDNIPAEISIGQNIPLQTNASSITGLTSLLGTSATSTAASSLLSGTGASGTGRQDVGTRIKVTPHVNDSDQIRLELSEEISEAGAAQGTLGAVPINKRTADTTLIVRDGQTVVIGGLVRDTTVEAKTKIPILGDIPILGNLFRQSSKTTQKTNLLLVLTPTIIRDQSDLRAVFERKIQERQEIVDHALAFGDDEWTPPIDYRRTNGLVEDIRQSMREQDEERRLLDETKPVPAKTHTPQAPLGLPESP